jgi:hypothetical protein
MQIGIMRFLGLLFPQNFLNDLSFEALFRSPVNLHQFFQICKTTIKRICCIGNIEIRMLLIGE